MMAKTNNKSFAKVLYDLSRIYHNSEDMKLHQIRAFFENNSWIPVEPFLPGIERNVDFSMEPTEEIITWFLVNEPVTDNGKFILFNALVKRGDVDLDDGDEVSKLRKLWRETSFNDRMEENFLKKYKSRLEMSDLLKKIEILTWEGQYTRAGKLISILPAKHMGLPKERLALAKIKRANDKQIGKSLMRYPQDHYIQYRHIRSLQKKGKEREAIQKLLKIVPESSHEKWWKAKNIAIRDAIKLKLYPEAYRLTNNHNLPYGADMAEAEWLAGWVSLRFLNNPKIAALHFETLYNETKFASSRSKATYWLGRSYEAMGDSNAALGWYNKSAVYKGTFYGNMAIAQTRANERVDYFVEKEQDQGTGWMGLVDKEKAKMLTHLAAILHEARLYKLVDKIFYSIAELELHPKDLDIYFAMLEKWDKKPLAVKFTRVIANRGAPLIRDGYPYKLEMTKGKMPKSLYLGIIRQESNFDQNAVSHAGARGLMQLMPGTAKRLAKKLKLRQGDYAHDPKVNTLYGVKYFDSLYSNYGSIPMAIAAYNAGPGNVKKWVKRYGDPRQHRTSYEVIDWIESIPYSETRNYVKSVLENSTIYDSILSKQHKPERLLSFLSQ